MTRSRITSNPTRSAFTLIEILIVMGIIVLLIALALPTFNYITGARSVEGATNLASSVLGIARANAVGVQQTQGVVFFRDVATDRMAMSLVDVRTTPFAAWVAGGTALNPVVSHTQGEYVVVGTMNFVCIQPHDDTGNAVTVPDPAMTTDYWRPMPSATGIADGTTVLEAVANTERQLLPIGVNARTAGNTLTIGTTPYRNFSPGAILFDANGQLKIQNYQILLEGILGNQVNKTTIVPPLVSGKPIGYARAAPPPVIPPLSSHIGFVFYNEESFNNATAAYVTTNQQAVDDWIDQNGTPIMLNRYNGTLVKGE